MPSYSYPMTQYEPFRFFFITCSLIVALAAACVLVFSVRSDDPVRDQLRLIAEECAVPDADPAQMEMRLNSLVDAHGIDFLIADKDRGDAFVRAGLEVQKLRDGRHGEDSLSTTIAQ